MNRLVIILMVLLVAGIEGIAMSDGNASDILRTETSGHKNYPHLKTDNYVRHMVNHPAFKGFGRYLLPWDDGTNYYNTRLSNVSSLLPYHNHVDPNIVVGAINHMIDEVNDGKTIFYNFYTEQQKQEDSTKESTGLFFFRGKPELRLLLCVREEAFPMLVPSMKAFHTL